MTLDQLRIFVTVAECEHLTRAAADLRLAPSAVSAAIRALETRHGVALFDRVARRIVLTEIGRSFLDEARAVLARASAAEARLGDLAGRVGGILRIEASLTIAAYWLPARLVTFRRAHPDVEIDLSVANSAHVARSVTEGTAEIGFVEGMVEGASLTVRTIARDHLMIVAAPAFASGIGRPLANEDLMGFDWVLREKGSGTRSEFEAELRRRGHDPRALRVNLELPSNEAVLAAVGAGGGVSALSASVATCGITSGGLTALDRDFLERPFQLLCHAGRAPTRAAAAFVAFLSNSPATGGDRSPSKAPTAPSSSGELP
jgi:DNA-binding transcriptional LysR family regulator